MKITKSYLKQIIKEELNKLDEAEPVAAAPQINTTTQGEMPKKQEPLQTKIVELTKDISSTPLGMALRKGNNDLERTFALLGVMKTILADSQLKKLLIDKYAKQNANPQAVTK